MARPKMMAVFVSAVLAAALCPAAAFADTLEAGLMPASALAQAEPSALTVAAQSEDGPSRGTFGTCDWVLGADGTLEIFPSDGVEGAIDCLRDGQVSSLTQHGQGIKHVKIEGKVKALNCQSMFSACGELETVDLGGLDTSECTSMAYMFAWSNNLGTVDLSRLDTSKVTDMSFMFMRCAAMKQIDLSSFDTSSIPPSAGTTNFINGCDELRTVYVGDKWGLELGAPPGCPKLKGALGSTIETRGAAGRIDLALAPGVFTYKGSKTTIYDAKVTFPKSSYAYAGKALEPAPTVKVGGKALKAGRDFTMTYQKNASYGTATAYVYGKGGYVGSAAGTFSIVPGASASPKITAKGTSKTVKASDAKAKAQTLSLGAKSSSGGKLSYKVTKANPQVTFSSGKAKLKKGAKAGAYSIKVKVTSAAKGKYKSGSKTFTMTFKVV